MKLLITGATGFVGSAVLKACIAHGSITEIFVLTRKPLSTSHPKITQIFHENFAEYPPDLLNRLRESGVTACIWCIGGPVTSPKFANPDEAWKANLDYPAHAAEAFAQKLKRVKVQRAELGRADHKTQQYHDGEEEDLEELPFSTDRSGERQVMAKGVVPFRFVYVSMSGAERNQNKKLWMYAETRRMKGAAESALLSIVEEANWTKENPTFEVIILRPGTVLAGKGDQIGNVLTEAVTTSISVEKLAKAALDAAMRGGKDGKVVMENVDCLGEDWAMVNSLS